MYINCKIQYFRKKIPDMASDLDRGQNVVVLSIKSAQNSLTKSVPNTAKIHCKMLVYALLVKTHRVIQDKCLK